LLTISTPKQPFGEGDRANRGLRRSAAWSVQLLVAVKQTDKDGYAQRLAEIYKEAFHQKFGTPLDPVTANELHWFWDAQTMASGPLDERRMRRRAASSGRRVFGPCAGPWSSMGTVLSMSRAHGASLTRSHAETAG